jgi:hypothetical protein
MPNDLLAQQPTDTALKPNTGNPKDTLQRINLNHQELAQIKEHLNHIIDTFNTHQSVFSRWASFWGSQSLWKKTLVGAVLVIPLLMIGIVFHQAVILTLGIVALLGYSLGTFLLKNHQTQTTANTTELKLGIAQLTQILTTLINTLEELKTQLRSQVEIFHKENEALAAQNTQLKIQIEQLTQQNIQLTDHEIDLKAQQKNLEQTALKLEVAIKDQALLLQKNHLELEAMKSEFQQSNTQLAEKNAALSHVTLAMDLDVKKAKHISSILEEAMQRFFKIVLKDEQQQRNFVHNFNDFLANQERKFDEIAEKLKDETRKIIELAKHIHQNAQSTQQLLAQVNDLEPLNSSRYSAVAALNVLGIHASPIKHPALLDTNTPLIHVR